jgi:hypothetical protein
MKDTDQVNDALKFDSVDELQLILKDLYVKQGISGVKEWIINNFTEGRKMLFKKGQSGQLNEEVEICDRKMEILDKNGINIVKDDFLPFMSQSINNHSCKLYFSLRILFINDPFGITIYNKRDG